MGKRKRKRFKIHIKPEVRRRILKPLSKALVLLLVLAVIFAATTLLDDQQKYDRYEAIRAEQELESPTIWTEENTLDFDGDIYGFDDRIETYLFIGTDEGGGLDERDGMYRGPLADFLMLLVIDHTIDTIGFIQIDRNTVTDVRELDLEGREINRRELQICTAHWFGRTPEMAAENTMYSVRMLLGRLDHIDGYFVLSMKNIGELNHAAGGVEVTIEDDMTLTDPSLRQGETLVLDDAQAEAYLRARMEVGQGDNVSRMRRQRAYMHALFQKVRAETAANSRFAIQLYEKLREIAITDMTGNDFSRIAQKLLKGEDKGIRTFAGVTMEGSLYPGGEFHEEFYVDEASKRNELTDLFSLEHLTFDKSADKDDSLGEEEQ